MRFVLFVHLVSMAFWLGGQLFLAAVAVPAMMSADPDQRADSTRRLGRMFGTVSVPVLLILLGTGTWMMLHYDLDPGVLPALQHKLELVTLVLVGTVVHSVSAAKGMKRLSRISSYVTLAATLGVIWYAIGY
jgi:uncharacterized membrane protein